MTRSPVAADMFVLSEERVMLMSIPPGRCQEIGLVAFTFFFELLFFLCSSRNFLLCSLY